MTGKHRKIDFVGRLALNKKGEIIYNFGKHSGKTIKEVFESEPGYHRWIIDNEFPLYTKKIVKEETDKLLAAQRKQKEKNKEKDQKKMENKIDQLKNKFNQNIK